MKKLMFWLIMGILTLVCKDANAQYITVITAPSGCVVDGSGTAISSGSMIIVGTDQNDNPVVYRAGTTFMTTTAPIARTITAGSLATSLQLADPASSSPLNVSYRIAIQDNITKKVTVYKGVNITPNDTLVGGVFTTFNFCKMNPGAGVSTFGGFTTPSLVSGDWIVTRDLIVGRNETVTGNVSLQGPRPWVDVTAFGAKGDNTNDDTTAIQNAINFACTGSTTAPANATCTVSAYSDVLFPQGTYKTTGCLQMYGSTNLIGAGRLTSVIAKSNNANCTAGSIAAPARALSDNYAVDAIIAIVHPTSDYAYHWKISGIGFVNSGAASTYGLFVPRASQSVLEDSYIVNTGTGFYSNDNWLMTIRHTTVNGASFGYRWANDGSNLGTGTTLTLDSVYAENIILSCFNIFGLQYSSFNNTACDNLNVSNSDNANVDLSYAAYGFNSSTNITLNGAGAENIHGTVLSSQASVLTVNAMRSLGVVGYTSAAGSPAYILVSSNGSVDLSGSNFDAMTSSGSFFNLLTQLGGMLTVRSTLLPTGASTFNSFSGGSSIINLNAGVMTLTNSAGVTTLSPTSAVFGSGGTFSGSVIPSVNGGFNSGGSSNAWLGTFQFTHHVIESTAPSSGGGQDICYGDSTAHAMECSYNAGSFLRIPQVVVSGTSAMTTAGITTGACGTTVTTAATGTATTDVIDFTRNSAATIANGGGLTLNAWPTTGNVNFNYCNSSAGTVTPAAMTVNWSVKR